MLGVLGHYGEMFLDQSSGRTVRQIIEMGGGYRPLKGTYWTKFQVACILASSCHVVDSMKYACNF